MTCRGIVVVSAGLGQPSSTRLLADRLAQSTIAALHDLAVEADVEVVELRDLASDMTNNLVTGFGSEVLEHVKERVAAADGVIAVTPIFSASYSGLFKTFFDVLDDGALAGTPVLIGATGGTARHSLALEYAVRPLFAYFRAALVPTAVFAASEDWGAGSRTQGGLAARIDRAGGELAALVASRESSTATDPYDDPVPFERLLGG